MTFERYLTGHDLPLNSEDAAVLRQMWNAAEEHGRSTRPILTKEEERYGVRFPERHNNVWLVESPDGQEWGITEMPKGRDGRRLSTMEPACVTFQVCSPNAKVERTQKASKGETE